MKTFSAKPSGVQRDWVLIDAENIVLGRLATEIAVRLRGKHKPDFTPHVDMGDRVIVVNAEKVKLTGKKRSQKVHYRHTGYPGGLKTTSIDKELNGPFPEKVIIRAVKGMLNDTKQRRRLTKELRVYKGPDHPHEAQQPKFVDLRAKDKKNCPDDRPRRDSRLVGENVSISQVQRPNYFEPRHLSNPDQSEDPKSLNHRLQYIELCLQGTERSKLLLGLNDCSDIFASFDISEAVKEKIIRMKLRRLPRSIMFVFANNLWDEEISLRAAKALTIACNPQKYSSFESHSNGEMAGDFESILERSNIDSFVTTEIEKADKSGLASLRAILWTGLSFELNGVKPRLPEASWLGAPNLFDVLIDGGLVDTKTALDPKQLEGGQYGGILVSFRYDRNSMDQDIYFQLTHNGRTFDEFTIQKAEAF